MDSDRTALIRMRYRYPVKKLTAAITGPVSEAGQCFLFFFRMLGGIRFSGSQILTVLQQVYLIGARSLVIIMTGGFFVGLVLTLQTYDSLNRFGAGDHHILPVLPAVVGDPRPKRRRGIRDRERGSGPSQNDQARFAPPEPLAQVPRARPAGGSRESAGD